MNVRVADNNSTYYGEADRHLKGRSRKHIGISSLTFKKTSHQRRAQFVANF